MQAVETVNHDLMQNGLHKYVLSYDLLVQVAYETAMPVFLRPVHLHVKIL